MKLFRDFNGFYFNDVFTFFITPNEDSTAFGVTVRLYEDGQAVSKFVNSTQYPYGDRDAAMNALDNWVRTFAVILAAPNED